MSEARVERVHHHSLRSLVLGEEQQGFAWRKFVFDQLNKSVDFAFLSDRLGQFEQLVEARDFIVHQFGQHPAPGFFVRARAVIERVVLVRFGYHRGRRAHRLRHFGQSCPPLGQGTADCRNRACRQLLQSDEEQHPL